MCRRSRRVSLSIAGFQTSDELQRRDFKDCESFFCKPDTFIAITSGGRIVGVQKMNI